MMGDVVEHYKVKGGLTEIFSQSIATAKLYAVGHPVASRNSAGAVYRARQLQDGAP